MTLPIPLWPYDRFITNFNNADRPNGGDGDLDLDTGVFTCMSAGHYTVNYSGWSYLSPGESVYLDLYHNGQELPEGRWAGVPKSRILRS